MNKTLLYTLAGVSAFTFGYGLMFYFGKKSVK